MRPSTALSHLSRPQEKTSSLSLGCPVLDSAIGGIYRGGVTDICGEAGTGKTQLCLTLSLQCQLSLASNGLDGNAAYMCCGEGEFPIQRLSSLAGHFEGRYGVSRRSFLDGVLIEQCYTSEDALDTLTNKLPKMCRTCNIKLIVIDSIAGLVRTEFDSSRDGDIMRRTSVLFSISQKLKWLATTFHACVVVANQVTGDFRSYSVGKGEGDINSFGQRGSDCVPALGLAWTHCINTRIMLYRDSSGVRESNNWNQTEHCTRHTFSTTDESFREASGASSSNRIVDVRSTEVHIPQTEPGCNLPDKKIKSRRWMCLQLSPCSPLTECEYSIVEAGLRGVV